MQAVARCRKEAAQVGVIAMNNKEELQQSARLLVDAFSNGTHGWNDSVDSPVKVKEEEENRETFRELPKAPQLFMPRTDPDRQDGICQLDVTWRRGGWHEAPARH
jgi:hypothetical protein